MSMASPGRFGHRKQMNRRTGCNQYVKVLIDGASNTNDVIVHIALLLK